MRGGWPSLPAPQPHRGCPILRVFAKGGYLTDRTRVVRLSGGVDGNKIRSSPHSIDGLLYGDGKSATPRFSGPGPWKARVIGGGGSVEINVNGVAGAARARQESDAIPPLDQKTAMSGSLGSISSTFRKWTEFLNIPKSIIGFTELSWL